jgi:hypothetical protein
LKWEFRSLERCIATDVRERVGYRMTRENGRIKLEASSGKQIWFDPHDKVDVERFHLFVPPAVRT